MEEEEGEETMVHGRHSHQKFEENSSNYEGRKISCDNNNKLKSVDKSKVECYKCHMYDHYKAECRTNLNKNGGRQSTFAEKEEEISLIMVYQEKEQVTEEIQQNIWHLDNGCSNHMCGNKLAFSILDESYRDFVKFGNDSKVKSWEKER
ncbi:hypothetical protein KY284_000755 [Solanum tuberosum]|nr:hypothetical protein KY284_000755 [Solanum tuberosum]